MEVREPEVGQVIAERYFIQDVLGKGGFGVVFRAQHLDMEREVALKVLLTTYARAEESAVERFRREAKIAASLAYPNTVRLFDYGETDDGIFYIAMELLSGETLTDMMEEAGRLPVGRAVHIIDQTLYALSEAHAHGIIHRDIKPDNVMLVPLSYDPDYVKVMDFGIAKMVSDEQQQQITRAGLTLGTPRYMPQEQLRGETLTPATDLYAVGLVMYEMLTGEHAITGESAMDLVMEILDGPGVTMPAVSGVPGGLVAIVNRAISKEATDRFQSAAEFLAALAPFRVGAGFAGATISHEDKTQMLEARPTPGPAASPLDATATVAAQPRTVSSKPRLPGMRGLEPDGQLSLLLKLQAVTLGVLILVAILVLVT